MLSDTLANIRTTLNEHRFLTSAEISSVCDLLHMYRIGIDVYKRQIMCYFVAEGFHYTRSIRKYTARMFLFAVISHFCYLYSSVDFAGWRSFVPFLTGNVLNQTSVMWSLAWGLVMLRVAYSERVTGLWKPVLILLICLVSFPSDWSCIAALCVLAFGTNRGDLKKQALWLVFYVALYSAVYLFAMDWLYGVIQLGVVLAIPILRLYNGQRGKNPAANRVMRCV